MADIDIAADMTEDSGQGDAGSSAQKQPTKAPKPPKPIRPQMAYAPEPTIPIVGKKKRGKLKIILIIVLVVLIAGFVAEELIFNYLGVRDVFIDAVISLDPDYVDHEQEYLDREAELNSRESDLVRREQAAASRETQNERRTRELGLWEDVLDEREQMSSPLWRRIMTDQELLDMQSLSRSYSLMAPESAADILVELEEPEDVAAILYFMTERSAAAILAVMEPDFAAELTEILLYK